MNEKAFKGAASRVDVLNPGEHARVDKTGPEVLITSVTIGVELTITYHCQWWVEGSLHSGNFEAYRLQHTGGAQPEKISVGFHKG